MPSVEMRRTTRVFGVVKGADGARVLRSGRRLWPESGDANKLRRAHDSDDWLHNIVKSNPNTNAKTNTNKNINKNSLVKYKENGYAQNAKLRQKVLPTIDIKVAKRAKSGTCGKDCNNKRFGIVYVRKRKRTSMGVEKLEAFDDKMYGIHFARRQQRRKVEVSPVFVAVVDSGSCYNCEFSCILSSVLSYSKRGSLRFLELAAFCFSEPVNGVFASGGIHFLQDASSNKTGICKFFGVRQFLPVFSVDFSAIPSCFMSMHFSFTIRVKCLSLLPVNNSLDVDGCDEITGDSEIEEDYPCPLVERQSIETKTCLPEADNSGNKVVLHPSVRSSRLAGRNTHYRNGLNSRGIQKRRSSLRRRRVRNPSLVGMHKANGALVSDLISSGKSGIPFSSVVSKNKVRTSTRRSSAVNLKDVTSTIIGVAQDMDLSRCSANVLVAETDRCYRIEGASVLLEISDSREWVLAVKKDGRTIYTHSANKVMRPCSFNRITHDIIWTGDEHWKLEFPNRQDWLIFKDLYKECSHHSIPASVVRTIPVPGVCEVIGYGDSRNGSFSRPEAYISLNNDEVARALAKRTASYDMDSEDEEWLRKFNGYCVVEKDHLPEDTFELMIDAFEKAIYCSPDDFANEKAAVDLCTELGGKEVVEAVYDYWMKKRKQRQSPLLRVFQVHQAKKAPLIPKAVLRKKRSFKRQPSQFGRDKRPNFLKAMAANQTALQEHNAMLNVEGAKMSARRSAESAIVKRHRAQLLMQNADLAVYKAAMALRIAEAARLADSTDVAVGQFFD